MRTILLLQPQDVPPTFIQHPDLLFWLFCGAIIIIGILLRYAFTSFSKKIEAIQTNNTKLYQDFSDQTEERFKAIESDVKEAKGKSTEIEKNYIKRFDELKEKISGIQLANEKNSNSIKTEILEAISTLNTKISSLELQIIQNFQSKIDCKANHENLKQALTELKNDN